MSTSTEFEVKVLALAYQDPDFMLLCLDNGVAVKSFFRDEINRFYATLLFGLGRKYGAVSKDMFLHTLGRTKLSQKQQAAKDMFRARAKLILVGKFTDLQWVRDRMVEEIRQRAYEALLVESVDLLAAGDTDAIEARMDEIRRKTAMAGGAQAVTMKGDFARFKQWASNRTANTGDSIRTGIREIDDRLAGHGLNMAEMTLVVGAPKRGKTQAMLWLAYQAMLQGKDVVYITLEVSKDVLYQRLMACRTNRLIREIEADPAAALQEFETWLNKPRVGNLMVYDLPGQSVTADDVRSLIQQAQRAGMTPKMVVVDYAKLLRRNSKEQSGWEGLGESVEILRGHAKTFGVHMVTGAQLNRQGTDKPMPGVADLGYDFSQSQTTDNAFILGVRPDSNPDNDLPVPMALMSPDSRTHERFTVQVMTHYSRGRLVARP